MPGTRHTGERRATTVSDILDELQWRGLVAQTTDESALRRALADGPITVYCGFDPTAPSLHIGNLVQLITLRHLQRAGHRVLCLVGGSTGLIGDPKSTSERDMHDPEVVADWVKRIQQQVQPFLDFEGENAAVMVNNLDWTAPMTALEFLRDVGKHFRVNHMIKKDAISARLNTEQGISYTEFSYQLLQGLDYLHLFRSSAARCRPGSGPVGQPDRRRRPDPPGRGQARAPADDPADHEGRRLEVRQDRERHGLAGPRHDVAVRLLPVLDQRRGRLGDLLPEVFTDKGSDEIDALGRSLAEKPFLQEAQRALAAEVTTLVHGAAHGGSAGCVRGPLRQGRRPRARRPHPHGRHRRASRGEVSVGTTLTDALVAVGLVDSRNAARRAIGDGGASLNNVKISDAEAVLGRRTSCTDRSPCCVAAARPSPPAAADLTSAARSGLGRTDHQSGKAVPAPGAVLFCSAGR